MLRRILWIIINAFILVLGLALIMQSVNISKIVKFNAGIILPAIIGTLLILLVIFQKPLKKITKRGLGKVLKIIFLSAIALYLILIGVVVINAQQSKSNDYSMSADAAIILGAGLIGERPSTQLSMRLDKAVEYSRKNKDALLVVSGGKGSDEAISEALAMRNYLLERGIAEERIVLEDRSKSTFENFSFSKDILNEQLGREDYEAVFITNDFHVLRAGMVADRIGFKSIEGIGSLSYERTALNDYLRETIAVVKTFITGK